MSVDGETISDVRLVHLAVHELDVDNIAALPRDEALTCWAALEEAHRTLAQVRSAVTHLIVEAMRADDEKTHVVDGVGAFTWHGKRNRTRWDTDSLSRLVLDSRIVDTTTGEVRDETPVDKIKHVWNLGAPRVTALRERGIDPDEYCTSEFGGWNLEVQ